ncbi:MAG: CAP domain-containing protein [Actinomycetota bacterium]
MRKRWIAGVLLAGLIPFGAPNASASSGAESCFISAINGARASAGRSRLIVKSDLTSAARRHSASMARDGRIYHSGNLGSGISGWTSIGENVGSGPSCTSVHRAFMNSSAHRANILRGSFNEVGVGVAYKGDTLYVTEIFVARGHTVVRHRVSRPVRATRVARRAPRAVRKVVKVVKPAVPVATVQPVNIAMLLVLVGLDAEQVNPATGRAMGV